VRSYFSRTFIALESPEYRLLWFGTLFSFLGMQMQIIARGYLAFELTGKNSALGGVMLAFGIPTLFLTLWGGVIADRLPKRRTLVVTQFIIALNAGWLGIMIATDLVAYWMLFAASFIQGAAFAFNGPARQAFVSELVGQERVGNAVVLQQLSMNSTRVIGPAMAGAFIGIKYIGLEGTYFMMTIGFLISTVTTMLLPAGDPTPRSVRRSPMADLKDGLRYVKSRPSVALMLATTFALTGMAFPFMAFLPSVAKDVYQQGASGLGLMSSIQAIGAVVATIIVATLATKPAAWRIQPLVAAGFGASLIMLGLSPTFTLALVAMVILGAFSAAFQSLNNALSLTLSAPMFHGRVQSLNMLAWSFFGFASMPLGVLADIIGIQDTLIVMGSISVVAVILLRFVGIAIHANDDRLIPPEDTIPESMREKAPAADVAGGG
jgi:MFS family permease